MTASERVHLRLLLRETFQTKSALLRLKQTHTKRFPGCSRGDRNELFEKAGQARPVGRVGEPEDLAETYLYLMRERFSTGAMIVVDGGSTLV